MFVPSDGLSCFIEFLETHRAPSEVRRRYTSPDAEWGAESGQGGLHTSRIALPGVRSELTTRQERMLYCAIGPALARPPLRVRLLHRDTLERVSIIVCTRLGAAMFVA